jgi:hypothetical protein
VKNYRFGVFPDGRAGRAQRILQTARIYRQSAAYEGRIGILAIDPLTLTYKSALALFTCLTLAERFLVSFREVRPTTSRQSLRGVREFGAEGNTTAKEASRLIGSQYKI